MTLVIDGNNLLYAFSSLRKLMTSKRHELARQGLVELVTRLLRAGTLKGYIVIVFDGKGSAGVADVRVPQLELRFAPHPDTADDRIVEIVRNGTAMTLTADFLVVSSDRGVHERVRKFGARVMRVKAFMEKYIPPHEQEKMAHNNQRVDKGNSPAEPRSEKPGGIEGGLPDFEVERWLEEFGLE